MEPDNEVQSILRVQNEEEVDTTRWKRPPSSYGSMKSDSEEEMEEDEVEEKEEEEEEEDEVMEKEERVKVAAAAALNVMDHDGTGLQLIRSESPETVYTMTTQQTKARGAAVIQTRSLNEGDVPEEDDDEKEEEEDDLIATSPEPPEIIEPESSMQAEENARLGTLHPENDMPHIFKSIQTVLAGLNPEQLHSLKVSFYRWESQVSEKMMEGDVLDFVDKAMEVHGRDKSLLLTIQSLEAVGNKLKADELRSLCNRFLVRHSLRKCLIRKHSVIHEGVVRAGCQNLLDKIYVEPEISTCGYGGVDPSHELRPHPPFPLHVPSADTFVGVNGLFRLQKEDGVPVRTVLTTGLPGIGMSVSVAKFSLDWAQERANRDLELVIKLSFSKWWRIRNKKMLPSGKMSIMEVIECLYPDCKSMTHLEKEGCKFLVIMDSFDCYNAPLDWQNAPVINDNHTQAHPDVLIVNIIRGTVLRGARVWILGRRAAVSQIPSDLVDIVTEIQGFSDEMKEAFLTKRASSREEAERIVSHFKSLPALVRLARQPFVCWMVSTVFQRSFRFVDYGTHPPRLTPFYVNILMVQMNRRLEFYCGKCPDKLTWSTEDKTLLLNMGKMALKMLSMNVGVFSEDDVNQHHLNLREVTVLSGMCTELPSLSPDGKRTFCFLHLSFQEFLAALYVFTKFRIESKNVLVSGPFQKSKVFSLKQQTKSTAGLVQCALELTLNSPLGRFDMFLRFLCGLLNVDCHDRHLGGFLFHHKAPTVSGLEEVGALLSQNIQTAPEDRVENLKECLREMNQESL